MLMTTMFPSRYLSAADLDTGPVSDKITGIRLEEVGDGVKPILSFKTREKDLVLNRTNANSIGAVYGDDTDSWIGREVELYPTKVEFRGNLVDAIRIRIPHSPRTLSSEADELPF